MPSEHLPKRRKLNLLRDERIAFLHSFLRRPQQVASVVPSSRFLERRLVSLAGIGHAGLVVELGPGTGGTTRALLAALPAHARLLCIELDPDFAARLVREPDPRLGELQAVAGRIAEVPEEVGADVMAPEAPHVARGILGQQRLSA